MTAHPGPSRHPASLLDTASDTTPSEEPPCGSRSPREGILPLSRRQAGRRESGGLIPCWRESRRSHAAVRGILAWAVRSPTGPRVPPSQINPPPPPPPFPIELLTSSPRDQVVPPLLSNALPLDLRFQSSYPEGSS